MAMGITRVAEQYGFAAESAAHQELLASYAEEAAAMVPRNAGVGVTAGLNDPRRMQRRASDPSDRSGDSWASGRDRGDAEHRRHDLDDDDSYQPEEQLLNERIERRDHDDHVFRPHLDGELPGPWEMRERSDLFDLDYDGPSRRAASVHQARHPRHPGGTTGNDLATDWEMEPSELAGLSDFRGDMFTPLSEPDERFLVDYMKNRHSARRQADMPVPRGTDPLFTERQEGGEHGDIYKGDGDWFSDYGMEPDADDRARWQDATRQRDQAINDYIQNTGLDPYVPEWQAREEKAQREAAFDGRDAEPPRELRTTGYPSDEELDAAGIVPEMPPSPRGQYPSDAELDAAGIVPEMPFEGWGWGDIEPNETPGIDVDFGDLDAPPDNPLNLDPDSKWAGGYGSGLDRPW